MLKKLIDGALHKNKRPEHKYFQVASKSLDGSVSVRTVVYRGVDENNLIIYSDSRSNKVAELKVDNRAEICWYLTNSREQFRFKTQCTFATEEVRRMHWKRTSPRTRAQFFWPIVGVNGQETDTDHGFKKELELDDPDEPAAFLNFQVILAQVIQFEVLDLKKPSVGVTFKL